MIVYTLSAMLSKQFIKLRKFRNEQSNHSVWKDIMKSNNVWKESIKKANGKNVLIATSTGGHRAVTPVESLLAAALTLRGARVHFLLCDKMLPACLQATYQGLADPNEFATFGPQKSLCDDCFGFGSKMYAPFNLPIHLYSDYISDNEIERINKKVAKVDVSSIKELKVDGLAIGEHALAGALRFFAKADISGEPHADTVLKRYLAASLITKCVIERLLAKISFDVGVFHHGIYVPQGIVGEVMRAKNLSVVNWNPAYRKKCFIFSHGDTYHHTLISEPTNKWENLKLTKKLKKKLQLYLKSRWTGSGDWIWFHESPKFDTSFIAKELNIDFSKPTIGMLTNVMWDAQLHYRENAFGDMLSWIRETIRYFKLRGDLQLVIRVHPAEIRGTLPSRQRVLNEIKKEFPNLPSNVYVIPPESHASTYTVMSKCNAVIIFGTKTGVELTSMGIPVIVAGEAWIRNKGLTLDAQSPKHYRQLLDKLPFSGGMDIKIQRKARKYAYHFFFRRMIPIAGVEPTKGWPPYELRFKSLEQLKPGVDQGLDTICDGILKGSDFIYKDESING